MQNAKDTFYEVLRDRVAVGSAALTVVMRGVLRPAVVVDENEVVSAAALRDCFRLRWVDLRVQAEGLAAMVCEIRYATAGTVAAGGLDRGRVLAAMDGALDAALGANGGAAGGASQWTAKKDFSALAGGGAVVALESRVWWSDVAFGSLVDSGGELQRVATVQVWSYREVGEA